MTWGEFKAHVEAQGLRDDDVIRYIDVASYIRESKVTREEWHGQPAVHIE